MARANRPMACSGDALVCDSRPGRFKTNLGRNDAVAAPVGRPRYAIRNSDLE